MMQTASQIILLGICDLSVSTVDMQCGQALKALELLCSGPEFSLRPNR